ncbi:MAG: hypothetical protein IPF64_12765 [Flavobacteriales bacterium]|nr:hypothetical protein [Flavobacteriales bacterium]
MSALVSVREPGELRQYFERKRAGRQEADPGGQCSAQQARASRVRCIRNNRPYERRPITTT